MGKRGQTKADVILSAARERMDVAQNKVIEAQSAARIAEAVYNEATTAYYALERSLAPKPRKKSTTSAPAQKELTPDKRPDLQAVGAQK